MNNSNYNHIGFIEIPTDDVEQTKKFYASIFGWEYEKSEKGSEDREYWFIKNAGLKGAITYSRKENQTPTYYVMVPSIDDFIDKSVKQGATIVQGKQEISEGYYATMQDKQNNTFGLWQGKD